MHRLQTRRLLFLKEQEVEDPHRAIEILPLVQEAYFA